VYEKALPVNGQPSVRLENNRILERGGYFLLFMYVFHAVYAAHTTPKADMSTTTSDRISYNDNGLTPFRTSVGGFWLTAYRYGNALLHFIPIYKICQ